MNKKIIVFLRRSIICGLCLITVVISLFSYSCRKDIKSIEEYYTYIDINDYARDSLGLESKDTLSGGIYLIKHKEVRGPMPQKYDKLYVYYRGKLLTGQEFGSQLMYKFENGDTIRDDEEKALIQKPFSFIFRSDYPSVIAGWDSVFGKLRRGDSATFLIPAKLAYGNVMQSKIPPNSPLRFDIKLLWLVGDTVISGESENNSGKSAPDIELSRILGLIK